MSLINFNLQEFEKILEAADRNGHRIRPGTPEAESYPFDHGIDIELVRQKMDTLTYPKIAIISNGSSEGMYLYSLKDKVCFYCETSIEENKRKNREHEKEEEIKTVKIIAYILFAFLGFIGVHRFYLSSAVSEDKIKELGVLYIVLFIVALFLVGKAENPGPLIIMLPLYIFDLFRIPFLARRLHYW